MSYTVSLTIYLVAGSSAERSEITQAKGGVNSLETMLLLRAEPVSRPKIDLCRRFLHDAYYTSIPAQQYTRARCRVSRFPDPVPSDQGSFQSSA